MWLGLGWGGGVGEGHEVGGLTRRVASLFLNVWPCPYTCGSCAGADFEPKLKAKAMQRRRCTRTPLQETCAAAVSPQLLLARLFVLMLSPSTCRQPTLHPTQWKLRREVVKNLPPSILRMRDSNDENKVTLEFGMSWLIHGLLPLGGCSRICFKAAACIPSRTSCH